MKRCSLVVGLVVFCAVTGYGQKKDSTENNRPVIYLNGAPVTDSVAIRKFDRIDLIQGKKAIDLLGPQASKGIYIISADGKIPVYGEVVDTKKNKIKNAAIISSDGRVLITANKCGTFFLPAMQIGETITIRKKGYQEEIIRIQQTHQIIQLKKR